MNDFSFDSHIWFDLLVEARIDDDTALVLLSICNSLPNKRNLELLKTELGKIHTEWSGGVKKFIAKMENGDYNKQFKFFENQMEGQCSQISELFSFMRQSINYYTKRG